MKRVLTHPFEFTRLSVTPAYTNKPYPCHSYFPLTAEDVSKDTNSIKKSHMALKGGEYIERAKRAVEEARLTIMGYLYFS